MIGADERLTSMSPAFRCLEAMQAEVRSAWTSVDGIEQFLVLVAPGVTAMRRLNDEAGLRALSRAGEIYARRHELDARRWSYSAEKGQSFESGFPDLDKVLGKVGAIIGKMS